MSVEAGAYITPLTPKTSKPFGPKFYVALWLILVLLVLGACENLEEDASNCRQLMLTANTPWDSLNVVMSFNPGDDEKARRCLSVYYSDWKLHRKADSIFAKDSTTDWP